MNTWTPHPAEPPIPDASRCGGDDAAMVERQLALLGRLAEVGLNIAIAIERQAQGAAPDARPEDSVPPEVFHGDLALAFARVSRSVRMTIALQSKLIGERRRGWVEPARVPAADGREARRARVQRAIEQMAWEDHEAAEQAEGAERLEDGDEFGDILNRPDIDIVDEICRELDLAEDWPGRAEETWAREDPAGSAAGGPLAALSPSTVTPPPNRHPGRNAVERRDPAMQRPVPLGPGSARLAPLAQDDGLSMPGRDAPSAASP